VLRSGIDTLDHRVLLFWIEIHRPIDDAPDVGLAVAGLGNKDFGRLPARLDELLDVSFFHLHNDFHVRGPAELGDR